MMSAGTRVAAERSADDGMLFTVAQSGRIAKARDARAAEPDDRRLPPLSAPGGPSRGSSGQAASSIPRPALLGATAAGLRRPGSAAPPGGAGAGRARGQPHRTDVHRGSELRLALRGAPSRRVRQPAEFRAPRR